MKAMDDTFRVRKVRDEQRRRAEQRAGTERSALKQALPSAKRLVAMVAWKYEEELRRVGDASRRGDAAEFWTAAVSVAALYLALRRMADACGDPGRDMWEALEPVLEDSWSDEATARAILRAAFEEIRRPPDAATLAAYLLTSDSRVPRHDKDRAAEAIAGIVAARHSQGKANHLQQGLERWGYDLLDVLPGAVAEALRQRGRGNGFVALRSRAINSLRREFERKAREREYLPGLYEQLPDEIQEVIAGHEARVQYTLDRLERRANFSAGEQGVWTRRRDGQTIAAIAGDMGITSHNVSAKLHTALRKMRKAAGL